MAEKKDQDMSKDEQIGFHKGSLATLAKEREEFVKVLGVVEQLMQMHIGALKELGVDIDATGAVTGSTDNVVSKKPTKKKPIEDIL
jgi:hypothetical protein